MGELSDYLRSHDAQFRKARLGALYSDFRHLKTTNPDGYQANIQAWQNALSAACQAGQVPSREGDGYRFVLAVNDALLRSLETKEWGRPLGLGAVIREGIAKKDFVPLKRFSEAQESVLTKGWRLSPWQVVSWGLRQVGLVGDGMEDGIPQGEVVLMHNLEAAAKVFADRLSQYTTRMDRVMSRSQFLQEAGESLTPGTVLSQRDAEVLLKFLARDKRLLAYDHNTVKLKGSTEPDVSLTTEDKTIASLKTLMSDMEAQIHAISKRVEALDTAAREAVAKQNRIAALSSLRSKKLAENNLSKQTATLLQLEEVYVKIGQAADQVALVRIMEGSTGVLRKLNAETGGIERVENVVEELHEHMTAVDDIGSVLAEPGQNVIDEGEVDDELEAMMAEEREVLEKEDRAKEAAEEHASEEATRRRLAELDGAGVRLPDIGTPISEAVAAVRRLSLEPAV